MENKHKKKPIELKMDSSILSDLVSELSSSFDSLPKTTDKTLRIDGHLNNPITLDECSFLLNFDNFSCRRHRKIKEKIKSLKIISNIYEISPDPWNLLYTFFKNQLTKQSKSFHAQIEEEYNACLLSALKTYQIQKITVNNRIDPKLNPNQSKNSNGLSNHLNKLYIQLLQNLHLINLYKTKRLIENYKNQFTIQDYTPGTFAYINNFLQMEKEISIISLQEQLKTKENSYCLCPTSLLLSIMDHIQCRYTLELYLILSDSINKYTTKIYPRYLKIYEFVNLLRQSIGEKIYTVLRKWDSLVIAIICANPIKDIGYTNLYNGLYSDLSEILDPSQLTQWNALIFSHENDWDEEVAISLELSSLSRFFGHPCITPLDGYYDLREKVTKPLIIDEDYVEEIRCTFVYLFIRGYIEKNKKWPSIKFLKCPHFVIQTAYSENRWVSKREDDSIGFREWECIELDKNFQFNTTPDTAELLSDKACAPNLTNWTQMFDTCAFKKLYDQTKPNIPRVETRVMLRYCKGTPNELEDILLEIEKFEPDKENDIAIICRKERELKEKGRYFCKQTYKQRLLQTGLESNIKDNIYPFFEMQTMSDSELTVKKKCANNTRLLTRNDTENINLDLMNWNMFQRYDSTKLISKEIDNLHGLKNAYQDSHKWMKRCYVMLNSRLLPPKIRKDGMPELGPFCHINQDGGFEGLRQKLWTLPTTCTIYNTAKTLGIMISLIGQGDNQVIVIKWSPLQLENKEFYRNRFLDQLHKNFLKIGLILKRDETWISKHLMEYSKKRYYKGVPLPSAIKRAKRCLPDENDGISTFEGMITSITTCTESIANLDYSADSAFIIHNFEVLSLFFRHNILNINNMNTNLLIAILFWSNDLGGLPISTYANHILRGIPDKLTVFISFLIHLYKFETHIFNYIQCLIKIEKRKNINYENLLIDIYSLNIQKLKTAGMYAKNLVKDCIRKFATNTEITSIMDASTSDLVLLTQKLMKTQVLYIPLFHEIIRNSDGGMILAFQNRLSNVQSIMRMADEILPQGLFTTIRENDMQFKEKLKLFFLEITEIGPSKYLINHKSRLKHFLQLSECSYQIAKTMRNELWETEIEGVTHPVPWEQVFIYDYDATFHDTINLDLSNGFISTHFNPNLNYLTNYTYKTHNGPFIEYFGSQTREKLLKSNLQLENPDPYTKTIQNLILIKSWLERIGGQDLLLIIEELLKTKLDRIPDPLIKNLIINSSNKSYGGNLQHRFRSVLEKSGALSNNIGALTSHIRSTTTSFDIVKRGGDDYNIFFQLIFLYIESFIISLITFYPNQNYRTFVTMLNCQGCTIKLPDSPFDNLNINQTTNISLIKNHKINLDQLDIIRPIRDTTGKNLLPANLSYIQLQKCMSVVTGIEIGKRIDLELCRDFTSVILDINQLESSSYSNINITELRNNDIFYVLFGILLSSTSVQYDIFSYIDSNFLKPPVNIFYPFSVCLLVSNQISDFINIVGLIPSKYTDTSTTQGMALYINRGFRLWFVRNFKFILEQCQQYQFEDINNIIDYKFWKWILQLAIKLHIQDLFFNITNLKFQQECLIDKIYIPNETIQNQSLDKDKHKNKNNKTDYFNKASKEEKKQLLDDLFNIRLSKSNLYNDIRLLNKLRNIIINSGINLPYILHIIFQSPNWINLGYRLKPPIIYPATSIIRLIWRILILPHSLMLESFKTILKPRNISCKNDKLKPITSKYPNIIHSLGIVIEFNEIDPQIKLILNLIRHCSLVIGGNTGVATNYHLIYSAIQKYIKNPLVRDVIILGDGEGGISNMLLHLIPTITNMGINNLRTSKSLSEAEPAQLVPSLINSDNCSFLKNKLKGLELLNLGETNILLDEFSLKLKKWVSTFSCSNNDVDLIIIDIETSEISDYKLLLIKILEYGRLLNEKGFLIAKIRFFPLLFNKIKHLFRNLHYHLCTTYTTTLLFNTCYIILLIPECTELCPFLNNNNLNTFNETDINKNNVELVCNATLCHNYGNETTYIYGDNILLSLKLRQQLIKTVIDQPCINRTFRCQLVDQTEKLLGCEVILILLDQLKYLTWENIVKQQKDSIIEHHNFIRSPIVLDIISKLLIISLFTSCVNSEDIIKILKFLINYNHKILSVFKTSVERGRNVLGLVVEVYPSVSVDSGNYLKYNRRLINQSLLWVLNENYCNPLLDSCMHREIYKHQTYNSPTEFESSLNKLISLIKRIMDLNYNGDLPCFELTL